MKRKTKTEKYNNKIVNVDIEQAFCQYKFYYPRKRA